jgi:hypothetical protein
MHCVLCVLRVLYHRKNEKKKEMWCPHIDCGRYVEKNVFCLVR